MAATNMSLWVEVVTPSRRLKAPAAEWARIRDLLTEEPIEPRGPRPSVVELAEVRPPK